MDIQHMIQQIIALAHKYQYSLLSDDLQPSIRLKTLPREESIISIGESKIGGSPDLPEEISWPEWNGISLPFISQIYLPDIAPYDVRTLLPHTGLLYFFFDMDLYFSSPSSPAWKVLYFNGALSQLKRTPVPFPASVPYENIVMPSCAIETSLEITIPPFNSLYREHIPLKENYFDLLEEVEHLYDTNQRPAIHRMLGHPNAIQNDMQVECQQLWTQAKGETLNNQTFKEQAKKWLLLMQVSWDENIQRDWADSGKLYYWIRQEDLEICQFDNVQFVHQSY